MKIHLPIPNGSFIPIQVDVVDADVHYLIGLDTLDALGLNVLTVQNELECVNEGWRIPLVRKHGHLYMEPGREDKILFTRAELEKLHRSLYHPSTDKLLNLLKRARADEVSTHTRKRPGEYCEGVQRLPNVCTKTYVISSIASRGKCRLQ
jgi:hypothetical protein